MSHTDIQFLALSGSSMLASALIAWIIWKTTGSDKKIQ